MASRHFLEPLLRSATTPVVLRNVRTGLALAVTVEAAFDSATRRRGLLGRDGLAAGHALVIAPSNLVHTFAMRFPIDIVFASREGRILKIRPAVPARRIAGAWRGFAVIEMAAGQVESSGSRVGDSLIVTPA